MLTSSTFLLITILLIHQDTNEKNIRFSLIEINFNIVKIIQFLFKSKSINLILKFY
jgi:hypothetical protein